MTSRTPALVVDEPKGAFRATKIERRPMRDNDVRIDIAYAGICHSDVEPAD